MKYTAFRTDSEKKNKEKMNMYKKVEGSQYLASWVVSFTNSRLATKCGQLHLVADCVNFAQYILDNNCYAVISRNGNSIREYYRKCFDQLVYLG